MTTKIERQNVQIIATDKKHPKHQPILDIIEAYQGGGNIDILTADWRGGGTSGEAIAEYVSANYKQSKKTKSTPKEVK